MGCGRGGSWGFDCSDVGYDVGYDRCAELDYGVRPLVDRSPSGSKRPINDYTDGGADHSESSPLGRILDE